MKLVKEDSSFSKLIRAEARLEAFLVVETLCKELNSGIKVCGITDVDSAVLRIKTSLGISEKALFTKIENLNKEIELLRKLAEAEGQIAGLTQMLQQGMGEKK